MSIYRTANRGRGDERDVATIRHYLERVYSTGELSLVDRLVASDFVGESTDSSAAYLGAEGAKAHVIRLRRTFNGFTIAIDDLHVEGGTFEVTWTASGTHERRFLDIDPTCNIGQAGEEPHGNRIAIEGLTTGTISNGKIESLRMNWDLRELRRQLAPPVEHGDTPVDSFDREPVSGATNGSGSNSREGSLGMRREWNSVGEVRS